CQTGSSVRPLDHSRRTQPPGPSWSPRRRPPAGRRDPSGPRRAEVRQPVSLPRSLLLPPKQFLLNVGLHTLRPARFRRYVMARYIAPRPFHLVSSPANFSRALRMNRGRAAPLSLGPPNRACCVDARTENLRGLKKYGIVILIAR